MSEKRRTEEENFVYFLLLYLEKVSLNDGDERERMSRVIGRNFHE